MKAVILAAGRGTRLGALTDNCPKPMIVIAGIPVVEYVIMGCIDAGIKDFVLVTKYLSEKVEEYFGDGSKWGINIKYVVQDDRYGTGVALLMSEDIIGDSDVLMAYGDCVTERIAYKEAIDIFNNNDVFAVESCNWVEDPWQGGAVIFNEEHIVEKMIEKPPKGTIPSNWNSAGIFVFKNEIFDYCRRLTPSVRGEYELPTAVSNIINDGKKIYAHLIQGEWCDMGKPEDIPKAEKIIKKGLNQN